MKTWWSTACTRGPLRPDFPSEAISDGTSDGHALLDQSWRKRRGDTRQLSRARGPLVRWAISSKTRRGEVHYPDLT